MFELHPANFQKNYLLSLYAQAELACMSGFTSLDSVSVVNSLFEVHSSNCQWGSIGVCLAKQMYKGNTVYVPNSTLIVIKQHFDHLYTALLRGLESRL